VLGSLSGDPFFVPSTALWSNRCGCAVRYPTVKIVLTSAQMLCRKGAACLLVLRKGFYNNLYSKYLWAEKIRTVTLLE